MWSQVEENGRRAWVSRVILDINLRVDCLLSVLLECIEDRPQGRAFESEEGVMLRQAEIYDKYVSPSSNIPAPLPGLMSNSTMMTESARASGWSWVGAPELLT